MESFDIEAIDEVVHGRVRLGVLAYLVTAGSAEFGELRVRLQTTDGNLSVHLRKLELAGYVEVTKSFVGRKPLARVQITTAGRDAFEAWLAAIERLMPRPV